jgi:RNase E specificity factor CsrD
MGLFRSFQLTLFVVFAGLLVSSYFSVQQQIELNSEQALTELNVDLAAYKDWQGNGQELYDKLKITHSFQLFQFIHSVDGSNNFTHGSLSVKDTPILLQLFRIELDANVSLNDARLQVRLDQNMELTTEFNSLTHVVILILLSYLLLTLIFTVLMRIHKQRIAYAASCMTHLADLSFDAIESSKLNSTLAPIAKALEYCRSTLKANLDDVKHENEALTKVAFQDPITGFATRQRFAQHIEKISQYPVEKIGILALIKASELAGINQLYGRKAGDDYLGKIANCIRKAAQNSVDTEFFRISSGDFAVFFAGVPLKEGNKFLQKLKILLDEYGHSSNIDAVAHTGMVPYRGQSTAESILSFADTAVSIAQTLGPNRAHVLEKLDGMASVGDNHWRTIINELITHKNIKFYQQPIQPIQNHVEVYRELLTRFYNKEGDNLPTASVIAMAERHGLHTELDTMIVISTLQLLAHNPQLSGNFGINISAASIMQDNFVFWLRDILSKRRQTASRLIFEVNEVGMQTNLPASHRFVSEMHKVGSKVAVERFGLGFTSFKFFREVRPDFIKLDNSYSEGIELDNNNRFFLRMIVDIAKRISIKVIATGVERQDEKLTLEKLLLDGLQGYYIAKPELVNTQSKQDYE